MRHGDGVIHGGVLRVELAGEVRLGDHGVMRREMVSLVTERADPDLRGEVHARVRVEQSRACLASQRRVWERGDIRMRSDRRNRRREWDHALARFNLRTWPNVPRHPDSVESLRICVRHLRHLFSSRNSLGIHEIHGIGNCFT